MKLQFVVSDQTNPFLNIAVENYLLSLEEHDAVTLYLWRNRRTVVIGQNQNPYAECNVEMLEADGGFLMRRRTGGGAVYHDEGNLNFSFVVSKPLYDRVKHFEVLCKAVADFGIVTEVSGRNDVLAEGRKFSGNAFCIGRHRDLHHGTILIHSNMDDLKRYLKPKPSKLLKHGVASVQSRVVNLASLNASITAESIQPHLLRAFEEEYGQKVERLDFATLSKLPEVCRLRDEFASDEWRLGGWRSFSAQRSGQFEWGEVELSLTIGNNRVIGVEIASDALDIDAIERAKALLIGADLAVRPRCGEKVVGDILSLVYG